MTNTISTNKTIAKNSMYLYIRMFLLMIISLYTTRVVLNTLGVSDYGIYSAIGGLVVTFSFLSNVLSNASQRFFAVEIGKGDKEGLKTAFNSIIVSYILLCFVIVLLLETIGLWFVLNKMTIPPDRLDIAITIFHFSVLTFVVSIMSTPFNALIVAHEDMKIFSYLSIIEGLLKLSVAFLLIYIVADKLRLYAILLFTVACIILISYYVISKKLYKININLKIEKNKIKEIFGYSSWTLFGTLAGVANGQCVNIMLNIFYGPIANAAYAIGSQISNVLSQFSSNFFSAIRPSLMKSYVSSEFKRMEELFYIGNKMLFLLMFIILLPIYFEIEFLLKIWLGKVEPYMISFTRLLLIYTSVLTLSYPITTIVQAAGAVKKYHGIVDTFTLLSLPISLFILKFGGQPEIVFIVSISIFAIAHAIRLIILKTVVKFSLFEYFTQFIIPMIVVMMLSIGVTSIVKFFIPWNSIITSLIVIGISVISVVFLVYFIMLSNTERHKIKNVITKQFGSKK